MDAKLIDIIRIPYWIAIGLLASLVESWMTYCGQQVSDSEKWKPSGGLGAAVALHKDPTRLHRVMQLTPSQ